MSSGKPSDSFDLERDLPTTPEDVEALRLLAIRGGSTEDLSALLASPGGRLIRDAQEATAAHR